MGIKKGVPLYSNLVNLKSNTMKNTMQSYKCFLKFVLYSSANDDIITFINKVGYDFWCFKHYLAHLSLVTYFLNLR